MNPCNMRSTEIVSAPGRTSWKLSQQIQNVSTRRTGAAETELMENPWLASAAEARTSLASAAEAGILQTHSATIPVLGMFIPQASEAAKRVQLDSSIHSLPQASKPAFGEEDRIIMNCLASPHRSTSWKLSHQIPNLNTGRTGAAKTESMEKPWVASAANARSLQPHPAILSGMLIPQASEPAQGEHDDWSDDDEPVVQQEHESDVQVTVATSQDVGMFYGGDRMVVVSVRVPDPAPPGSLVQSLEVNPFKLDQSSDFKFKIPGRVPSDVCCVIDISGSMGTEATYEDEHENKKSDGLSYLDIVKHAVKTLIHMLGDQDRLALVAFDSRADLVFAVDFMTTDGRGRAIDQLEALQPRSTTDIWQGLRVGLEALRTCDNVGGASRPKAVLLLTDGVPNPIPPKAPVTELRDYKERHTGFGFEINTFGFGHELDSELLLNLAVEGHGTYAFIPDALVVGTSFVNSCASILTTFTQTATLHLTAIGGAQIKGSVIGVDKRTVSETSWGHVVDIGSLHFGGTREVALPLQVPAGDQPYIKVVLVYVDKVGKERQVAGCGRSRRAEPFAVSASVRSDVISTGYGALVEAVQGRERTASTMMSCLVERLKVLDVVNNDWVLTLRGDVSARVSKALQGRDRFDRWGKHYLRAFLRAHQVQRCTNFLDNSLQVYGGCLFRALREEGSSIFVSLPPPRPSKRSEPFDLCLSRRPSTYPAVQRVRTPSPDMNVYYGGSGGG